MCERVCGSCSVYFSTFYRGCLRSWLEQATICPTCRRSLSEDLRPVTGETGEGSVRGRRRRAARRIARNWLLHFNGASIANWLPTFSLQLHQEDENPQWVSDAAQLHREVSEQHTCTLHGFISRGAFVQI